MSSINRSQANFDHSISNNQISRGRSNQILSLEKKNKSRSISRLAKKKIFTRKNSLSPTNPKLKNIKAQGTGKLNKSKSLSKLFKETITPTSSTKKREFTQKDLRDMHAKFEQFNDVQKKRRNSLQPQEGKNFSNLKTTRKENTKDVEKKTAPYQRTPNNTASKTGTQNQSVQNSQKTAQQPTTNTANIGPSTQMKPQAEQQIITKEQLEEKTQALTPQQKKRINEKFQKLQNNKDQQKNTELQEKLFEMIETAKQNNKKNFLSKDFEICNACLKTPINFEKVETIDDNILKTLLEKCEEKNSWDDLLKTTENLNESELQSFEEQLNNFEKVVDNKIPKEPDKIIDGNENFTLSNLKTILQQRKDAVKTAQEKKKEEAIKKATDKLTTYNIQLDQPEASAKRMYEETDEEKVKKIESQFDILSQLGHKREEIKAIRSLVEEKKSLFAIAEKIGLTTEQDDAMNFDSLAISQISDKTQNIANSTPETSKACKEKREKLKESIPLIENFFKEFKKGNEEEPNQLKTALNESIEKLKEKEQELKKNEIEKIQKNIGSGLKDIIGQQSSDINEISKQLKEKMGQLEEEVYSNRIDTAKQLEALKTAKEKLQEHQEAFKELADLMTKYEKKLEHYRKEREETVCSLAELLPKFHPQPDQAESAVTPFFNSNSSSGNQNETSMASFYKIVKETLTNLEKEMPNFNKYQRKHVKTLLENLTHFKEIQKQNKNTINQLHEQLKDCEEELSSQKKEDLKDFTIPNSPQSQTTTSPYKYSKEQDFCLELLSLMHNTTAFSSQFTQNLMTGQQGKSSVSPFDAMPSNLNNIRSTSKSLFFNTPSSDVVQPSQEQTDLKNSIAEAESSYSAAEQQETESSLKIGPGLKSTTSIEKKETISETRSNEFVDFDDSEIEDEKKRSPINDKMKTMLKACKEKSISINNEKIRSEILQALQAGKFQNYRNIINNLFKNYTKMDLNTLLNTPAKS